MPVLVDFSFVRSEDQTLAVSIQPAVPVSGWTTQFLMMKRFGGVSGIITKSMASGYQNVSGMAIANGAQGQFNITINAGDTSGLDEGAYAYSIQRLDSGSRTVLTQGFVLIGPNTGTD